MAMYVSRAKRKRTTLTIATAAALIGLVLGWVIGHSRVPTIDSRVASVELAAEQLASRIGALPIEYRQGIAGQGDTIQAGVLDAVAGIRTDTLHDLDRAPWIAQSDRDALVDSITRMSAAASAKVDVAEFEELTSLAAALVRSTFGLSASLPEVDRRAQR